MKLKIEKNNRKMRLKLILMIISGAVFTAQSVSAQDEKRSIERRLKKPCARPKQPPPPKTRF
jgi:hypothetical protein